MTWRSVIQCCWLLSPHKPLSIICWDFLAAINRFSVDIFRTQIFLLKIALQGAACWSSLKQGRLFQHTGDIFFHLTVTHFNCIVERTLV